ncbi:MAG: M24 family metallopeptidase [Anaerolineae bacterium]
MTTNRPRIPTSEFQLRVDKVRREMAAQELDCVFVYGDEYRREYLRYVSNYWPIFERGALIIPRVGEPILLAAPEGEEVAREMSPWRDVRLTTNFACVTVPDGIEFALADLTTFNAVFGDIQQRQTLQIMGVVGVDAMSPTVWWALEAALPGVRLVQVNDLLVKMRLVKSANEVACLMEAARIADLAYQELMDACVPGNSEVQAAAVAEGAARAAGAEYVPFTVFGSGKRTDTIVGRATNKIIAAGDMIMAALAVQYEGYIATVEWPFVVGKMSDAQRHFIDAVIVAEDVALPLLSAGVPAGLFVQRVHEHFTAAGYVANYVYPPLHGIGCAEAEAPYPDAHNQQPFEAGHAVNTDISLFRSAVGSNRIEEGFIVTEGEPIALSPLIRRLAAEWLGHG